MPQAQEKERQQEKEKMIAKVMGQFKADDCENQTKLD